MNKRAVALIMALLVTLVLSTMVGAFFLKVTSENSITKRQVNSIRAFWAAEAGVAQAIANLSVGTNSGTVPNCEGGNDCQYAATTSFRVTINSVNYYDIASVGTALLSGGANITRTINVVARTGVVDPTKFKYGIQAANDLCWGAQCSKDPNNYLDPDTCNGVPCWKELDGTINFSDMFGYSQADINAVATHYTENTWPGTISGVTWVDVTPGQYLNINGNETGTGILIVNGDVHCEGTYQFHGIMYVLGNLQAAHGTYDGYGSIIVASSAGIDTVNGSPEFHYNPVDITTALQTLASNFVDIVSWKES